MHRPNLITNCYIYNFYTYFVLLHLDSMCVKVNILFIVDRSNIQLNEFII